ncbi:MAG TPA: FixH family protein [Nitrospirota bacterium]|nr:FixH family protein [Nitrospirota bacterium]
MNKYSRILLVAFVSVGLIYACTRGYEMQKTGGNVTITLSARSYPLVKGDNALTVKLADSSGKLVTDAKVDVRYYMPAMPGMAPMEYTTQSMLNGDTYAFKANIPMEGGWRVDVTVNRGGTLLPMVTFNVDAR